MQYTAESAPTFSPTTSQQLAACGSPLRNMVTTATRPSRDRPAQRPYHSWMLTSLPWKRLSHQRQFVVHRL